MRELDNLFPYYLGGHFTFLLTLLWGDLTWWGIDGYDGGIDRYDGGGEYQYVD